MDAVMKFFLGTPKRALITFVAILVAAWFLGPQQVQQTAGGLLIICIMIYGLKFMIFGPKKKKEKK